MTDFSRFALVPTLLLATATGYAQNQAGFSGRVTLGYLATSGNTENETLNSNFELGWNRAPWHHALTGSAVRASTDNVTTAEAYSLDWQSGYDFTETSYAFGRAAWDEDKFSGYARQVRVVGGYGRRIIDMERHALNGEVGVGLRESDLRDGTNEDETILRLSGNYLWTISETSKFSQSLSIESGSSNTFTEAVTKLTANIRGDLSVVLSYRIRKNSDVPVGTVKTDTFTAVALEYAF